MSDLDKEFRRLIGRFQRAIRRCGRLKARDKVVGEAMLDRLDRGVFKTTGELRVWDAVGVSALATDTALCERDVVRARAVLRAEGIIEDVGRPAKGRPAPIRFCPAWVDRQSETDAEPTTEDTGVPDTGVLRPGERRTPDTSTEDSSPGQRRTPESYYPCNRGITVGRAGTPTHAKAGTLATLLATHFQPHELSWFEGAVLELDGSTAVLWAPNRHGRDWIEAHYADRLKAALLLFELEVRLGTPALPHRPQRPELHAIAGGRA